MILMTLMAVSALASVTDDFGSDTRAMGMAGDSIANPGPGTAARANPANLGRTDTATLAISFVHASGVFRQIPELWWDTNQDGFLNTQDSPLTVTAGMEDVNGYMVSFSRPLGSKIGIGLVGYLPAGRMLRFQMFEQRIPTYYQYNNRYQRYTLALGAGAQLPYGLSVGASADIIASADFTIIATLDAHVSQPTATEFETDLSTSVHDLFLDVRPDVVPIIGLQWDLGQIASELNGVTLGVRYQGTGGLNIDADLDVQANIGAQDIGDLDPFVYATLFEAGIILPDHYIPRSVAFGFNYAKADSFAFHATTSWMDWRPLTINVARITDVAIDIPLASVDSLADDALDITFRPVWKIKAGGELGLGMFSERAVAMSPTVRIGMGLNPAPLVSQSDNSALLDGDTILLSTGLGATLPKETSGIGQDVRFDVAYLYQGISSGILSRSTDVPAAGFPIDADSIPIGGVIHAISAGISIDY